MSCSPSTSPVQPTLHNHKYTSDTANLANSVLAVMRIVDNRVKLVGSAVVISCEKDKPIRLVTAYHVPEAIEENDPGTNVPILVGSVDSGQYQATKVIKARPDWDLAVLEGLVPLSASCASVPVSTNLPEIGSGVWLVGNPLAHEKNVSHGVLSHVYFTKFFKGEPLVYRIDAAAAPGNSGGGLFNKSGELIGILSFTELRGFAPVIGGGHAISLVHLWILLKDL